MIRRPVPRLFEAVRRLGHSAATTAHVLWTIRHADDEEDPQGLAREHARAIVKTAIFLRRTPIRIHPRAVR